MTLGPTREYIDDIRFITNPSSGKMGAAIANAAVSREWDVVVVAGPCDEKLDSKIRRIDVVSADQMTDETLRILDGSFDALICVAAIADYTPERRVEGKIRSKGSLSLELKPTRKLIEEARKALSKLKIIAFKAESQGGFDAMEEAARKVLDIADLVVLNDVSQGVFGADSSKAWLVGDTTEDMGVLNKIELAEKILDKVDIA